MDKHNLLTEASINAWIVDNQPGGEDKLADRLVSGALGAERDRAVLAYFAGDTDRLRVAERALAKSVADSRPKGLWAQRGADATRWAGTLMMVLALIGIILMPLWSA